MKELIGIPINAIYVSRPGQHYIKFDAGWKWTGGKELIYMAEPDCCSESWFADIINPGAVIGKVCTGFVQVGLPNPADGRGRQEVDRAYGCKLFSESGISDIIFRNSSNGYYGGTLSDPLSEPPVTDYRTKEPIEWEPITKDWMAEESEPRTP